MNQWTSSLPLFEGLRLISIEYGKEPAFIDQ